jgi:hypothetical protein
MGYLLIILFILINYIDKDGNFNCRETESLAFTRDGKNQVCIDGEESSQFFKK